MSLGDQGEGHGENRLDTAKGTVRLLDEIGEFFVLCSFVVQLLPACRSQGVLTSATAHMIER